jgi:hypothetical protein
MDVGFRCRFEEQVNYWICRSRIRRIGLWPGALVFEGHRGHEVFRDIERSPFGKSGSLNTLLNAYKMGRNDAGLIVLKNGVDAGFVETRVMGWNAMWYATTCEHPCKKCVIQAAKYGVDVNHRELQSNRTVLFKYVFNYSQSCRDLDMVTLLAKTLDVNAKDADGLTAYDWTHIRHYSLTCWPTSPTPYNVSAQKILIAAGAVTRELSAPFACR